MNASNDLLAIVGELNVRRIALVTNMQMRRHDTMQIPPDIMRCLVVARKLHQRFWQGDYRTDTKEIGHVKTLCEWLIVRHAEMNGHPARCPAWNDASFTQVLGLPPGRYGEICRAIEQGKIDG